MHAFRLGPWISGVVITAALTLSAVPDFEWMPTLSQYRHAGSWQPFYSLSPLAASVAGLGSGAGYGTTSPDGAGNPLSGTTGYGGMSTDSLIPEGIHSRAGHYYFGFANTYPNTNQFSAYELSGTPLGSSEMDLYFRVNSPDRLDEINFIGMCGPTSDEELIVGRVNLSGQAYLRIQSRVTNPKYSPNGGADHQSAFGMYINYGQNDAGNQNVDYHGAVFSTDIHWWDIDVPNIPGDKLASIKLNTNSGAANLMAFIPDSYFNTIGLNPADAKGYVDGNEMPLGQDGNGDYYFSYYNNPTFGQDLDMDGVYSTTDSHYFQIRNDQWSEHDLGFGLVPEFPSVGLAGLALMLLSSTLWRRKH